jgi:hypothetical protein
VVTRCARRPGLPSVQAAAICSMWCAVLSIASWPLSAGSATAGETRSTSPAWPTLSSAVPAFTTSSPVLLPGCFVGKSVDGGSRLVPNVEGPERALKRGRALLLSCTNMVEVQVNLDGRDTSRNLLPCGRVVIAADLPIQPEST